MEFGGECGDGNAGTGFSTAKKSKGTKKILVS